MAYGYRYGEVNLPDVPRVRDDVSMELRNYVDVDRRRPVAVDLGVSVLGQSQPKPDTSHGPTVAAGLAKRVCAKLADPDLSALQRAREFVRQWCLQNLEPLSPLTDLTRQYWLDNSNYPEWKKVELREQPEYEPGHVPSKEFVFKSFVKDECYPEWKHCRSIQAPTDALKAHLGPVIAQCEKVVFSRPEFIKKIPVDQRPKYIASMFQEGVPVAASDFSSFEVSWQRAQMEAFEFPVLEHLLSCIPGGRGFMQDLRKCEAGKIDLVFKHVTAHIVSTRKSGTMNTSFSNGVGNFLIHAFAAHELNLGDLVGIFEGDDGLFQYSSGRFPTPEFYENLGFSVKLEIHPGIHEASFCGMVFDPTEQVAVWDPVDFITRLGWGSARYMRSKRSVHLALLRCKAMSLAAQCPRAPVLAKCADWILRCTSGVDTRKIIESRNTGWWERNSYLLGSRFADTRECGPATRSLVERKFGLSVADQLRLEQWFDAQDSLCHIPRFWDNDVWSANDDLYVTHLLRPSLDEWPILATAPLQYPPIITEAGVNKAVFNGFGQSRGNRL